MITVTELWRYPVKSMAGERLPALAFGVGGALGDRAWAVRDDTDRAIRGAKRFAALMGCAAWYAVEPTLAAPHPPAQVRLPDGTIIASDAPDAAARLTALLGRAVSLWPLQPATDLAHYRRGPGAGGDPVEELRQVFGRTADEPLPDLAAFPRELAVYESPPGTYFDAYPVLVVATASLARLQRRAPGSVFDVRRFRPNIVVDAGDLDTVVEAAWAGRSLRIGDAVLDATIACPRCIMTTHGFDDLPRDPSIMRTLVREAGGELGIYATVRVPGAVAIGDAMTVA